MEIALPYAGAALLICVIVAGLVILAKHNLRVQKLKHGGTVVEFETASTTSGEGDNTGSGASPWEGRSTRFSELAEADCKLMSIPFDVVIEFILDERSSHFTMFNSPFTSVPLAFHDKVLLLSWDGRVTTVERVLSRQEAYPLNDTWTACLSRYRETASLPYRRRGPDRLVLHTEATRTLNAYRRLTASLQEFIRALGQTDKEPEYTLNDVQVMLSEAESAFASDDPGTLVTRLEVILSTVHKFLLRWAPQGLAAPSQASSETCWREPSSADGKSALVVEDDERFAGELQKVLYDRGFAVCIAHNSSDAMRALVDHEFDIAIVDLIMLSHDGDSASQDGRELVIAIQKASPDTAVVVVTGYGGPGVRNDMYMGHGRCVYLEKGKPGILRRLMSALDSLSDS